MFFLNQLNWRMVCEWLDICLVTKNSNETWRVRVWVLWPVTKCSFSTEEQDKNKKGWLLGYYFVQIVVFFFVEGQIFNIYKWSVSLVYMFLFIVAEQFVLVPWEGMLKLSCCRWRWFHLVHQAMLLEGGRGNTTRPHLKVLYSVSVKYTWAY